MKADLELKADLEMNARRWNQSLFRSHALFHVLRCVYLPLPLLLNTAIYYFTMPAYLSWLSAFLFHFSVSFVLSFDEPLLVTAFTRPLALLGSRPPYTI